MSDSISILFPLPVFPWEKLPENPYWVAVGYREKV
jgi:hypothetical protein